MVSALCLAWLFTVSLSNGQELVPGQISNTGNLTTFNQNGTNITQPWQNVGQWGGQLTCWGPGNPGYCGPNPYVNANGQGVINFSYGYTDLYQVVNIANALPNSGTGLRVNGFNFGFMAKNGNGWDNGQQDYLVAYVNFYDTTGKTTQSYNYGSDTNRKYNWTQFNFSETFTTPYASKDLSTARYGFVGYDTNYWAGPYGPEIYNVSFSLKYSVDPCFVNVLSSPSCPGYLEALNKLSPKSISNDTQTTVTSVSSNIAAPSISSTVSTDTATAPTTTSAATTSQPSTATSQATASVTPSATNPQPRVGEVTVSGSPARVTLSTNQILSIVRSEQSRISNLESSVAQQAILQAQQQAESAQAESLTISANTISNSNQSSQQLLSSQIRFGNIYSLATGPVSITQSSSYSTNNTLSSMQLKLPEPSKLVIEETTRSESMRFTSTDLLSNFMNVVPNLPNNNNETQKSSVNQQAQDNEAAGNVTISSIAVVPNGFDRYNVTLKDVVFYEPKEIYRNQNVVDNARAQRGLQGGSDRLHQEMVDSQYNRK